MSLLLTLFIINVEQHLFHIVNLGLWPTTTSVSLLCLTLNFISFFHYYNSGSTNFVFSLLIVCLVLFRWLSNNIVNYIQEHKRGWGPSHLSQSFLVIPTFEEMDSIMATTVVQYGFYLFLGFSTLLFIFICCYAIWQNSIWWYTIPVYFILVFHLLALVDAGGLMLNWLLVLLVSYILLLVGNGNVDILFDLLCSAPYFVLVLIIQGVSYTGVVSFFITAGILLVIFYILNSSNIALSCSSASNNVSFIDSTWACSLFRYFNLGSWLTPHFLLLFNRVFEALQEWFIVFIVSSILSSTAVVINGWHNIPMVWYTIISIIGSIVAMINFIIFLSNLDNSLFSILLNTGMLCCNGESSLRAGNRVLIVFAASKLVKDQLPLTHSAIDSSIASNIEDSNTYGNNNLASLANKVESMKMEDLTFKNNND